MDEQQFQQKQMASAMKALQMFMTQNNQMSQATGVPAPNPQQQLPQIAQAITKQQMLDNNPALAAQQAKEEEKAKK